MTVLGFGDSSCDGCRWVLMQSPCKGQCEHTCGTVNTAAAVCPFPSQSPPRLGHADQLQVVQKPRSSSGTPACPGTGGALRAACGCAGSVLM